MSIELRREYLEAIRDRYQKSTKRGKGIILNEFCASFKYNRKYAIKILNRRAEPRTKKPGPARTYAPAIENHLVRFWEAMGRICSKNMKAAMPGWLPYYRGLSKEEKDLLLKVSPATIDRVLKPHRNPRRRGLSGTKSFIKSKIPIELLDKEVEKPGYIESDTVAHCGDSLSGTFINSLTMTDIWSGWTENRGTLGKEAEVVLPAIKDIERELPFLIWAFASDNGSEFMNEGVYYHFRRRRDPVKFVRRRPYKKNDAAHVEQKNNTHVRDIWGYERFESQDLLNLMNDIYKNYWNPLKNYFIPNMKLKSKVREGSKVKKTYDEPKTPYQRITEHPDINPWAKGKLYNTYQKLNPFTLKRELDRKLNFFFRIVEMEKKIRKTAS